MWTRVARVRSKSIGSTRVLELDGMFYGTDGKNIEPLREAIAEVVATGNSRLVLDMSKCKSMTSDGYGVLMLAYGEYNARGALIRLTGRLSEQVKKGLITTNMFKLFDYYPSVDEALASFTETSQGT